VAQVDHLGALRLDQPAHDVDGGVVAVEQAGGGDEAHGGDLFAIVWDPKTKKLHGYNGSGRSPQVADAAVVPRQRLQDVPPHGPLPVTVPGTVDGWFALHERFGKLPMRRCWRRRSLRPQRPSGARVIAYYWARSVPLLSKYPGFAEQFTIDGRAPRTGEMWKNPNLAEHAGEDRRGGRDGFYKGDIARTIDAYFKAHGGFLSLRGLAAHRGEWVEPVSTNYRGVDVWELPPNGQGIAALQILNMLEGYDLAKLRLRQPEHVHLFVEAKKLAFEDRARWYADPEFSPAPGRAPDQQGLRRRAPRS
jgi:gamma-glutamyltranspeptidase / glutathione hydrolase